MVIAALFIRTKVWKQPKCPSVAEQIQKAVVLLRSGIPAVKKGNLTFCNSTDGPGDYHTKGNRPVRERQIPYGIEEPK